MADSESDGIAARFRSVFFSYDRDTELPEPGEELEEPDDEDPDGREGAILRGVDLDVPDDSFTVVMGASGGGKSTLVRCLNAVVPKHYNGNFAGTVDVLGEEASSAKISRMARLAGMVMQNYEAQLFGTSLESEVAFGPENLNVDAGEIGGRIDRMLELVELEDLNRHRPPAGLSGGQKQRLVVASVLAMHPRLLILDEPTSDLDPRGTRDLLEIIQELAEDGDGLAGSEWAGPETFVMVTHKIEEAVLADHAVLLKGGRRFRSGPAREVFTDVEALQEARVAVPPLVDAFDRLGFDREHLPLTPGAALDRVDDSALEWTPPGTVGEELPNPARTGESVGDVLFEIDGLTRTFDTDREQILAVDDVDLEVRKGEFVAVVGHNGSGKTTLAKHLNGLLDAQEGSVRWDGREVASLSMSEIGRRIGYVFQNPDHQLFASTVREELEFGPTNFGFEGEDLEEHVRRAAETVDLEPLLDADPFNLSKGQRQRVALGGILATDPEVIVFDEPTTGLDAPQARQFMDLVARLNREEGVTVVMVTHGMRTVATYAPRTVVMEEGRKVADTRTRELFGRTEALDDWDLMAPQQVELSNRLAEAAGLEEALPALSVDELVEGLGGEGAVGAAASAGGETDADGPAGAEGGAGGED